MAVVHAHPRSVHFKERRGASTGAAPNKIQFNSVGGFRTYISSRCIGEQPAPCVG